MMSAIGLRDFAYLAVIAALVFFQAQRSTSHCARENEDILVILRDLVEGQTRVQQALGLPKTTEQSQKLPDTTQASASKEGELTSGIQGNRKSNETRTPDGSLPLYDPSRHAEPGGENCSLETQVRADGGTTYAISPSCYQFPFLNIHVWDSGFSAATCDRMIAAAEDANRWTRKSTTLVGEDVGLDEISLEDSDVHEVNQFVGRLSAFIQENFIPAWPKLDGQAARKKPSKKALINYGEVVQLKGTPFIIRYAATTGFPGLHRHKDNTDVSFIVLLSDTGSFTGGGTHFDAVPGQGILPMRRGEVLVFNGQLVHGALPITAGKRYVLSGFTTFDSKFWNVKRQATLATSMRAD